MKNDIMRGIMKPVSSLLILVLILAVFTSKAHALVHVDSETLERAALCRSEMGVVLGQAHVAAEKSYAEKLSYQKAVVESRPVPFLPETIKPRAKEIFNEVAELSEIKSKPKSS